jgi:hypothetical protein
LATSLSRPHFYTGGSDGTSETGHGHRTAH